MIAQLIPTDGREPVSIEHDVTVVGRTASLCDLVLDHPSVSKVQAVLARTDGLLFFRDLASTNGTRVNGQRAIRGALLPNDEIMFGKVRFIVYLGPAAPVPFDDKTEAIPAAALAEALADAGGDEPVRGASNHDDSFGDDLILDDAIVADPDDDLIPLD